MERINDLLCGRSRRGMFVTLLYMVLDPQECTLTCVNAVISLLFSGTTKKTATYSWIPWVAFQQELSPGSAFIRQNPLEPGDCLFLSTEDHGSQKCSGERLGTERMEKAIRSGSSRADEVYLRVMGQLKEFVQETPPADDLTLVLLGSRNPDELYSKSVAPLFLIFLQILRFSFWSAAWWSALPAVWTFHVRRSINWFWCG